MLTRRALLKSTVAAAAVSALPIRSWASPTTGATVLEQFSYDKIKLLPGPLHEQFTYHHRLLLSLDNDKLLKPFRERTGLAAPGEDMGGWYSNSPFFDPHGSFDGFVPGHSFGQYLSALSRASVITSDPATRAKVQALVTGISPTLTSRFYDNYTLPAYTFDKTCCGLQEAYAIAGIASAGPALDTALAAALPHLPEKALSRPEQRVRPHTNEAQTWDETYTLPENLFLAYKRTNKPAYRDAAIRFLEDDLYFNPLSEDINVLPGEHAYSHVNAFSSAMQAYLVLGSEKHLRAAKNAFRMLEAQSFATGGWGPGETLLRPNTDELAHSLFTQAASFETPCGAYGHFKITRYLLRVTGDPHYGDSMERVLYNTVAGAKPMLADGSAFYYSDFTQTGHKTYARDKWPCCSGTLPQIAADYGISTYLSGTPQTKAGPSSRNGLTVILYIPSQVTFDHAGSPITLTQETTYPATPTTSLRLELAKEAEFPITIRIPAWSGPATRVLINGKPADSEVQPGTFHTLHRTWKSGDRIELAFEMPLRTETLTASMTRTDLPAPHSSAPLTTTPAAPILQKETTSQVRLAALMRGPVVFMATGAWPTEVAETDLTSAKVASSGESLVVQPDTPSATTFKPYTLIGDETYRTYQPLKSS
ncbi:beta-L-arabinofuranosidase domain-containing protein [Granulicella sibirica]|uniref:Putative glycosyl hydrolase (DUF1680) n=1 Tax=Granulicella sibirica TaxID=2479048 RepID=A0A4Q0SYT6_9BACT|nr:beta-L-arabinofuranosidase domain-containing protein [Granulicella sibirica]RXH54371.1 putative glycosyl hydrolase (DUF1680) [Granulicella sibirica]